MGVDLHQTGRSVSLPGNGSVAPVTISLNAVLRARRTLCSGFYDVVHVHEPFTPGLPYGLLVGRGLPPLVATFHRSGVGRLYRAFRPLTGRLVDRIAVCCAVSESARDTAAAALGGTYAVGFNGVEVSRYRDAAPWPSERPTILFLGRHEERKGLGILLAAVTGGSDAVWSAVGRRPRLWIAGDGPQTDALRRSVPAVADVEWLGVLSETEKEQRLVAADILCAPSFGGESFGMVLVEAMAARTVVVASDIDGYRQTAGGHAVLVPPGQERALAEAVSAVLSGAGAVHPDGSGGPKEARQRWLDEAEARAAGWSMERLAQWYEPHYRTAVAGHSL